MRPSPTEYFSKFMTSEIITGELIRETALEFIPDFHDTVIENEVIQTVWICPDCDGTGEVVCESGCSYDLDPTQTTENCECCNGKGVL